MHCLLPVVQHRFSLHFIANKITLTYRPCQRQAWIGCFAAGMKAGKKQTFLSWNKVAASVSSFGKEGLINFKQH